MPIATIASVDATSTTNIVSSSSSPGNADQSGRRRKLIRCLSRVACGLQILCGLAASGSEFLFHGLNWPLHGAALTAGLLLTGAAIFALTMPDESAAARRKQRSGSGVGHWRSFTERWARPVVCLACLPACLAAASLATFSRQGLSAGICGVTGERLTGPSTDVPANATAANAIRGPIEIASTSGESALPAAFTPAHPNVVFWSRFALLGVLFVGMATTGFLTIVTARMAGCRRAPGGVGRGRHVRPSSLSMAIPGKPEKLFGQQLQQQQLQAGTKTALGDSTSVELLA